MEIIKKVRGEGWLHDSDAEVAVPLEITCRGGVVTVEYYPSAKSLVDELLDRFGGSEKTLFSRGAALWAYENFGGFLESFGFSVSPDSDDYYVRCTLRECSEITPELTHGVRRLYGGEGYKDLTDTDIDGLCEQGYIVYAAVVDGSIVAVANTGEPVNEDTPREVEIGIDTAQPYRRRGFGRACVAALVRVITRGGRIAVYECASDNTASIRLAESLGGEVTAKKYYIVGFRDLPTDSEDYYGI